MASGDDERGFVVSLKPLWEQRPRDKRSLLRQTDEMFHFCNPATDILIDFALA